MPAICTVREVAAISSRCTSDESGHDVDERTAASGGPDRIDARRVLDLGCGFGYFNDNQRDQPWGILERQFFLRDLKTRLAPGGRIVLAPVTG